MVYIKEAHAVDEWPLGHDVEVAQPKTLEERLALARQFRDEHNVQFPIVVDGVENHFTHTFSAWPERYYLVEGQRLAEACEPTTEYGYDRLGLRRMLRDYVRGREEVPDLLRSDCLVFSDNHCYSNSELLVGEEEALPAELAPVS